MEKTQAVGLVDLLFTRRFFTVEIQAEHVAHTTTHTHTHTHTHTQACKHSM
jgi:hypothetical protein